MKSIKLIILLICSVSFAQTNLLDSSTWTVGTGSVSGFGHYGADAENIREIGVGPHGTSGVLWKAMPDSDTSSNYNGGWETDYLNIDYTKTYRFTSWVKKTNSNDGSIYFAFYCKDDIGNNTGLRLDGTVNGAPYPFSGDLPLLDQWYLIVGYIHESNYSTQTSIGGIYDINGIKQVDILDFKFSNTATRFMLRNYLRASNNTSDKLFFYDPTIYEINGQEPTIQELIDGPPDTQAPTVSTLSSTAQADTTVDLSWTAATDDTAVTGYKVYKDAVLETTLGNVLSYQVTGLTASTAYNFTVTALDAAGNESVVSNTVAITTDSQTDAQAPTAPTLSSTAQTDSSVALSWTAATDDVAVTGYKVYKDAVLETTLGNVLTYQVTGLTASTAYNFTVTALDAAGNESMVSNTMSTTTNNAIVGNLLDSSTWTVGTGSVTGFNMTGTDAENIREIGVGPHGTSELLWKAISDGLNTGDDGGWKSETNIDPTKTYRFTVWVKKTNSNTGSSSFGIASKDALNGWALYSLQGDIQTWTYFYDNDLPSLDQWYLVVGYVHHSAYTNTASIGGIYDGSTGLKVLDMVDKKFQPSAVKVISWPEMLRSDNTSDRQFFYDPTIYEVNGLEPTIQELIDGPPDTQVPIAPTVSSTIKTDTTADLSWTAATDNIAVTGYKVYKDAVLDATLGNVLTYQVTGLTAAASYNFTVTALDAAGNESVVSNTVAITTDAETDTQAPTAPTLSSTAQIDTSVALSWTAATDDTAVTGYKVYKDAVLETTLGNVLNYQVTGLTAVTAYNFTVTALDATGNESVVSNTMSTTTNNAIVGNLLDTSTWTVGTGSVPGFTRTGTDVENIREMGIGPHSSSVLLWKAITDGAIGDDGGWKTDTNIDPSKTYRFTVWVKKMNSNDGNVYFGISSRDGSNGWSLYNLQGGVETWSSFFSSDLSTLDKWYLLVGYVHHSAYTNTVSIGGIYDEITGTKVFDLQDRKFQPNAVKVISWPMMERGGNIADSQFFYNPTMYEVNGQEPTIQELIDGPPDTQAPTASTVSSSAQTDTTVDLSWTVATDNVAVTGYKVYKDAVLETTLGNVLSHQVTGLTAVTTYNFTVTALDAAGNESVVSNILAITTNVTSGGGSGNWTLNNQNVYYNTGNVGIGTNIPDEKLAVNGNIHAKEVRVDLSGWPDYVFTKTYDLRTLKQVAEYIKAKGHLPNIPSAKEVEENGILLGDMNTKLLEKIEELTLYILEQEKRIEKLEKQ